MMCLCLFCDVDYFGWRILENPGLVLVIITACLTGQLAALEARMDRILEKEALVLVLDEAMELNVTYRCFRGSQKSHSAVKWLCVWSGMIQHRRCW